MIAPIAIEAGSYVLSGLGVVALLRQMLAFPLANDLAGVRFVDPKPNQKQVWGMDPELRRGNDLWLESLSLV
jgi:hypothetical protein